MTTALQSAIDAIASAQAIPLHKATATALIKGWHKQWQTVWHDYIVLDVEKAFTFPLLNPETEGESKTFIEAGKLDALLMHRFTGIPYILEHKTTSEDVDSSSVYWDRLMMDTQISKYVIAVEHDLKARPVLLYDVTRKPGIRPCAVPLTDEAGLKIVTDANGARVNLANGKPRQSGDTEKGYTLQTRPETDAEYEARLSADIETRPDRYYAHREIARTDGHVLEYMDDAWNLSQQLLYYRRRSLWPRNPAACSQFGKCEYFDLCTGRVSAQPPWYQARAGKHTELPNLDFKGRDPLTTSLLGTLRSCARKYQLRYEAQIEAVNDEGKDALHFGTLYHTALEAYFNHLKNKQ